MTPTDVGETSFDLGSIKASRDFYFLLSNTGSSEIEDVVLTSSNDAFQVTPSEISVIKPASEVAQEIGVTPVMTVSVIHGVELGGFGLGFADVLPAGENSTVLSISGKTTDGEGAEVDVGLDVELTVEAQVVDLELYCAGVLVDFASPYYFNNCNNVEGPISFDNYSCNGQAQIKNIGTVDFTANLYDCIQGTLLGSPTCSPGETISIADDVDPNPLVIEIDGDNTAADSERFELYYNGNIYFSICSD